jgi:N-acylneuraminate cytidylyltransferase
VAVIPARAGSKRIPGKNIRVFGGKPLIAHTIEAAVQTGLFARVVVTTDSSKIAEEARRWGAETPFLREPSLADDFVPVSAATVDVLERIDPEGGTFDSVCQLMPNCPLRKAEDIRDSFRQFSADTVPAQLSVVRYGWQNPWWAFRRDEHLRLTPLFTEALSRRSQDLPELFCPSGAVWWARADSLRREGTFHLADKAGWEIPWTRGVDIDTEDDWVLAEILLGLRSKPIVSDS